MGIATLLKGITWAKLASLAIEHGPGLYRQARERFQTDTLPVASAAEAELLDRVARLEKLLLEQEMVIREQTARKELIEKSCQSLESQLLVFRVAVGVLALGVIILLAVLFK